MYIHHIGIATRNIEKSIENLKKIYNIKSISDIVYDKLQKARLCFIETNHGINLELIEGEQVEGILAKGINYYHICFSVKNIESEIEKLQEKGAMLISKPKKAVLFGNKLVAFLLTKDGLIELVEEEK